ncbi:peptidase domain-containing ABC transporter [Algimonas porphyrae]|uniref:ABC transporter n=1 Tax=Algimonas porphyrae TaxID=1128113 RepID=A0ABQ5UZR0_9PROT|nr:peptidase domain-containing ABC transporter [Algimonas porphyrae]GLQ20794.1 ABC transporter [Algimonas porphyrae]
MAELFSSRLPVILQTEMTECGLACLAMVARYHGHDVDLNSLRDKYLLSMRGTSLKQIIKIAGSLSLSPRALRVDLDQLHKLATPAILHWDLNHYVVLKRVRGDRVFIHDPGIGQRTLPLSKVSDHFTGVALELTQAADFQPITDRIRPRLSDLWSSLVGAKRAVAQTLLLSIALLGTILMAPFLFQLIVDAVLPSPDLPGGNRNLLIALAIGFGALTVMRAIVEAARGYTIVTFGAQLSRQMVGNIFRHLIRLPVRYFERRHVGDIISRMNSTQPIQEALSQSVVSVLIDGAMATLMLFVMFIFSPLLALIVVITTALLVLATLVLYPRLRATQEEAIYARALENSHVIESIRASTTVKLFGREAEREASWANLFTDFINSDMAHQRWQVAQTFAQTLLIGVQVVAVVVAAAWMMTAPDDPGGSTFTVGMLVAFLIYRQYFADAVVQLVTKGNEFRLLSLHLDRLADIIHAAPDRDQHGYAPLGPLEGRITLNGVTFAYSPEDPLVVTDFDLDVAAGEMVTLTGPSGGGKTTLMKLMLGLYAPNDGSIQIDGRDLSTIDPADWRSRVGVVMQDDRLLSGTIADNIAFFDPEIDMQRVIQAAQAARIHETIAAIPMNYLAVIGDMGSILSGGQKQRLLLARALYQKPDILFLDEGTANLDTETEAQIVALVSGLDMTRVIVAHRPAFLEASDRVITVSQS